VSVRDNMTKLWVNIRLPGSPSDWKMEMLVITDMRPTGDGEEDQVQKCPYI
jgi:hypothetical protein